MISAIFLAAAQAAAPASADIVFSTPGIMIEGVAADRRGTIYASDLYGLRLLRRDRNGRELAVRVPASTGISTLLGLKPSPDGRRLWVCGQRGSTAASKSAVLVEADAATLRVLKVHPFPAIPTAQLCNDLDFDGRAIIVSESEGASVWRFDRGRFARLAATTKFTYPNGVAVDPGRRLAFVAHSGGLVRIDLRTGSAQPLVIADKGVVGGIDGLYFRDGALLGVQNLTQPMRIIRVELGRDGRTGRVREVVRDDKRLTLPTTGAFIARDFWAVADAQFLKLKDDKLKDGETVEPTRLIRFPL